MIDRVLFGDCRASLRRMADAGVRAQMCVTSPPYFGLRDYGADGQIGLEATPEAYVAELVEVFRAVRDLLADDGLLWLNLGDCYAGSRSGPDSGSTLQGSRRNQNAAKDGRAAMTASRRRDDEPVPRSDYRVGGLKPKDLIGVPWRVAFALQADGWVLRQEIIWAKPNAMPESVTDRCTKSHEQIFMFSKARWSGPEAPRFSHISDADARWLALLIDAEGCIVVKRNKHEGRADTFAPQVSVGSTSRALMDEVRRIVGHGSILERPGKNAPMFYWQVSNGLARDFLHRIYPFLIIKPRQARIGIYVDSLTYFRGGKKPERKVRTQAETDVLLSLWARNKECNSFGDPDISDVPEPSYGRWRGPADYFYDHDAIKESISEVSLKRINQASFADQKGGGKGLRRDRRQPQPLDA